MRKFNKFMAAALAASFMLSFSIPALADDSTQASSSTTPATVQPAQPGTQTPANRLEQAKDRIQKEILRLQQAQEFQQYMGPIRQLQAQARQLRQQIHSLRQTIRQQIRADRQAKNYTALLAALNDMLPMQDEIQSAIQAAQTAKADWQKLQTDNKAGNTQAMAADLQKIQSDIQNRINVYQKILADLQKISQDLGQSNPGGTTPPTQSGNNSASSSTTGSTASNS